ncbi:hypothetical protein [Variovorax sp. PAMC26660]|uniref:hypothetical protein n=1 Tax=Variovorax sp. PAMC26660 TaxID=2762322 RepID=UPI00164D2E28|nr:hypothetical protein [Variovorax sp. PAMC26660]QNK69226.1 hypothetical protein H7F35_05810 [Variovorax sp. PAMC26660]
MTARAFEIADDSMFSLLINHCVIGDEHATILGLVDEAGIEVRSLAVADPNVIEAVEWLMPRGYVEVAADTDGEHVLVLRRPGEDS